MLAHDSISTVAGAVFTGEVEKIVESGAQAVFLAGGEGKGTVALWRELHSADPQPAAARLQRDGQRIVRLADRRGGGEHLPDDAGARRPALPAGGPAAC